ncbi:alcohol dehydrogenase, partial [Colletotrichum asianum]
MVFTVKLTASLNLGDRLRAVGEVSTSLVGPFLANGSQHRSRSPLFRGLHLLLHLGVAQQSINLRLGEVDGERRVNDTRVETRRVQTARAVAPLDLVGHVDVGSLRLGVRHHRLV